MRETASRPQITDDSSRLGTEAGSPVHLRPDRHRSRPSTGPALRALAALMLALSLAACSTDFDPFADGPPYFALDAALDSRDDTLFVRVQDFRVPPGAEPALLDARVTLESLSTGAAVALRDSLTLLDAGTTGHLFWTTASIEGGQTYQLRAARAGDESAASTAQFEIPTPLIADTSAASASTPSRRLDLNGLLVRPAPVLVTYDARRLDTGQTATVTVTYFPFNQRNSILVSLGGDADRILGELGLPDDDPQQRAIVTDARVTYRTAAPSPVEVADGRGLILWRATLTADWRVPAEALAAVNLQDGQDG
ncbi:MAG: hypothetical protein AAGI52_07090 [Bacteroidota bacterium]